MITVIEASCPEHKGRHPVEEWKAAVLSQVGLFLGGGNIYSIMKKTQLCSTQLESHHSQKINFYGGG